MGVVSAVGSAVTKVKVGDKAGVGCLVGSCRQWTCHSCKKDLEQYCPGGVFTYNAKDPNGTGGGYTYGGYSQKMVIDDHFVLRVPDNLDLAGAAPLLCAGITTYSPLRHWNVGPGSKVGVVGLGGLGHMGVKFARAFGAHVVLFTSTASKTEEAKRLGAHDVVCTKDPAQLTKHHGTLDFILNTVSAPHNLDMYMQCLTTDGTMCLVGAPPAETSHVGPKAMSLIFGRKNLAGSLIGGVAETQEMLDFCGVHNILSNIEIIPAQQINQAYERVLKSDVRYRFVIDASTI